MDTAGFLYRWSSLSGRVLFVGRSRRSNHSYIDWLLQCQDRVGKSCPSFQTGTALVLYVLNLGCSQTVLYIVVPFITIRWLESERLGSTESLKHWSVQNKS